MSREERSLPFEVRAERLRWGDVMAYLEEDDRVLLPVGALEQHGAHLAMGTDTMTAAAVSVDAARAAGVLVYPPVWYGWSESHMAFAGSVTLSAATLQAVLEDVVLSLCRHGFRRFVLVNGNRRANLPPMQIAASNLMRAPGRLVAVADVAYLAFRRTAEIRRSASGGIGHAGEMETSHMLYLQPDCVWPEQARACPARPVGFQASFLASDPAHESGDRYFLPRTPEAFRQASRGTGVAGDPTVASRETGELAHQAMVEGLIALLDLLKATPVKG